MISGHYPVEMKHIHLTLYTNLSIHNLCLDFSFFDFLNLELFSIGYHACSLLNRSLGEHLLINSEVTAKGKRREGEETFGELEGGNFAWVG